MHFNTKYIFKGDTEREIIGKINYNFDQILSFAVGPDGHDGPRGATGIYGPAGRRGATGNPGIRASNWYKQPTEPTDNPNTHDVWIDNSVSDGNIKVFNYPLSNSQWQNSGYSFLNSKYFQSYSYIQGPGGDIDKYVIGFKNPGGITGAASTSLLINDTNLTPIKSNPNNSKVIVSTSDQTDRPIMTFSKNGVISSDVPSFYWNSSGNNTGLKFDNGGAFYVTSNNDFVIDSGLARTLISSNLCTFRNNQGTFSVRGDGDFSFSSNISLGIGGFLNISTGNFQVDNGLIRHGGGVTITSPLTSTYILSSNPSSPSYENGISVKVTNSAIKTFEFEDYTGNAIMYGKPSGSVSSGNFAQTVFGTSGGFTGGTGGPFSYHVRKVKEVRKSTTGLSARQYLTTTNANLTDVLDMSSNTIWENDVILATPTAYSSVTSSNITSYKIGDVDTNFNYLSSLDIFGTGFKNSLTGTGVYDAVVNDSYRFTDPSSPYFGGTIFAGNFKYYNDLPVKNGSLGNTLGVVIVNADGTLNTAFRTNISGVSLTSVTSVNGVIVDEANGFIYIYGCFVHSTNKNGILCLNMDGTVYSTFNTNMGTGIDSGGVIHKAAIDPSGSNIFAVGNFYWYKTSSTKRNKMVKIRINQFSSDGLVNTTFLGTSTSSGPGFLGTNIPYCFDFLPGGTSIIVGGSFGTYVTNTSGSTIVMRNVVEVNNTTGANITTTGGFANVSTNQFISTDPIVSAIKYNSDDAYIYIGGSFSKINSVWYGRIARFYISGGNFILDTTLTSTTGFNDTIYDFAFDSGKIYVGGRFTSYRGTTCPAFIRINSDGSIDPTASIYHNIVSPKTIQPAYEYTIGLVKKIYLDSTNNEFLYVGGFLGSIFSSSGSNNGIYLKVPSSITPDYVPVYADNTTTNYRVFLNDPGNDNKLHYIKGLVFDSGLPSAVTSYIDFSSGSTGCQYVDLMWVSKTSTANIANPRLFYKNCEGYSGYVDFNANGVYSSSPSGTTTNTGQNIAVLWEFSKEQTGSCTIYKNGTSISNRLVNRTTSGSGSIPYVDGDGIYAVVSSGGFSGSYVGYYASLVIRRTSLTTGATTTLFSQSQSGSSSAVNNFLNPVIVSPGFSYRITCVAQSEITGSGCCFVGDTKVTMYDGSIKNIDSVLAGDAILTYNVETDVYESGTVTSIESPIKDDIIEFILSNGTIINATTEHPFWVIGKGWSSYSPDRTMLDHQMEVSKIEDGDLLLDNDGNEVILLNMNEGKSELQKVYNLLMAEGNHTYFANGILVHNKLASNDPVVFNNGE